MHTYQFEVLGMRENCLSEIDRSVDYRLFLFAFQYARYDRLRGDTIASAKILMRKELLMEEHDKNVT